ncbi:hypothetical protein CSOJ01_07506 [Colletotrichum sojae]|uniref:Uncharacterized protein n=1 Tax=Colletotrichum sojae TaxID=2175907 RepID=A0A8H6J979_9PEZI|nr:hypothetical protein CSOJ01_07506 [Colletotrichum sojae]
MKRYFAKERGARVGPYTVFAQLKTGNLGLKRIRADGDEGVRWLTISKDCTKGARARQSELLRDFGKRLRLSTGPSQKVTARVSDQREDLWTVEEMDYGSAD